jgi:hypothetical protein
VVLAVLSTPQAVARGALLRPMARKNSPAQLLKLTPESTTVIIWNVLPDDKPPCPLIPLYRH